jgi:hypothetical protein
LGAWPMPCDIGRKLLGGPPQDPHRKGEPQEADQKISDR